MEDSAPPHRFLVGGGGSPRPVGKPRTESSRTGANFSLGPSSMPLFTRVRGILILGNSLSVVGRPTDEAPQAARRDAPPLQRLLGLHRLADPSLPLGPAIVFGGTCVEDVQPFEQLRAPPRAHNRVPFALSLFTRGSATLQRRQRLFTQRPRRWQ